MEPISGTTAAITIFPLMLEWIKERAASKQPTMSEFMEWLLSNHHNDIKILLESNERLSVSIKAFIVDNHQVAMKKLDEIHKAVTKLYASDYHTGKIINAIEPTLGLSEQAKEFLKQINDREASKILEIKDLQGTRYRPLDGNSRMGSLEINEKRFIHDDLNDLVNTGCLLLEFNDRGAKVYCITRLGASIEIQS